MTNYNDYLNRLKKIQNTIRAYKKVFLISLMVFCALIVLINGLSHLRGIIISEVECPDIVYGEKLNCSAKALWADISYKFYTENGEEPLETEPTVAGTYVIEAIGGNGASGLKKSRTVFSIKPKPITLTPDPADCNYDEPKGQRAVFSVDCSDNITILGAFLYEYGEDEKTVNITPDPENTIIYDENGNDVSSCYIIKGETVTAWLLKRTVYVKAGAATFEYDDQTHYPSGVYVEAEDGLSLGIVSVECDEITGSGKEIGSYKCTVSGVRILDSNGIDISGHYNIVTLESELSIVPRALTVKVDDAAFSIDKINEYVPTCCVKNGTLLPGHELETAFGLPKEKIGEQTISVSVKVKETATGKDVTSLYDINIENGTVTVQRIPITIKTGSVTAIYDGKYHFCPDYEITSGALLEGHTITILSYSQLKYAGEKENQIEIGIRDNNYYRNAFYDITFDCGTLTITPAKITLKSGSASKQFDGSPLKCNEITVVSGTIYDVFYYLKINNDSSQTEIGSSQNTFRVDGICSKVNVTNYPADNVFYWQKSIAYDNHEGTSFSEEMFRSYEISYEYGTLEVVRGELEVCGIDAEKQYDGTPLTCKKYVTNIDTLPKGLNFIIEFYGSQTEIGSSKNAFDIYLADSDGKDVTEQYFKSVKKEYGTLTVTKKAKISSDVSGTLSKKPFANDETVLFKFQSDYNGIIYLKRMDYNRYESSSWSYADWNYGLLYDNAEVQLKDITPYNPLGVPKNSGSFTKYSLTLWAADESVFDCTVYPNYILGNDFSKNYFMNLYERTGASSYSFTFAGTAENLNKILNWSKQVIPGYKYRNCIGDTVDIPLNLYTYFNSLSSDSEFVKIGQGKSDSEIADLAARYVGSRCNYTMAFAVIPKNADTVEYFLSTSKTGICQHFASAVTMICRYYGVSARYSVGFAAESEADKICTIKASQAHAWCEIYDNSLKEWVIVECTKYAKNLDKGAELPSFIGGGSGSTGGSGETGGSGGGGAGDDEPETEPDRNAEIVVTVLDAGKTYDGQALVSRKAIFSGALAEGDILKYTEFTGSQIYVGSSAASCIVKIYDSNYDDVTDKYKITVIPGVLTVNPVTGYNSGKLSVYVDQTFEIDVNKCLSVTGPKIYYDIPLLESDFVMLPFYQHESGQAGLYVGFVPCDSLDVTCKILNTDVNEDGIDEIAFDSIPYVITVLKDRCVVPSLMTKDKAKNTGILPENDSDIKFYTGVSADTILFISMKSEDRTFDGKIHSFNDYEIICGSLPSGYSMVVYGTAENKYVGAYTNSCQSVYVLDEKGKDVTEKFFIRTYDSIVRITKGTGTEKNNPVKLGLFEIAEFPQSSVLDSNLIIDLRFDFGGSKSFRVSGNTVKALFFGKTEITVEEDYDFNHDGVTDYTLTEMYECEVGLTGWQILIIIIVVLTVSSSLFIFRKKKREEEI